MLVSRLFVATLLFTAASLPAHAAPQPLTKAEVEKIVREYLLEHPEVILESIERMQQKAGEAEAKTAAKAITAKQAELLNDAASPVAGNTKGDVTLVQFFDYNCGYCKKVLPTINELISKDKNLRVVYKELPVLAPASETAAKWALAVHMLDAGKYFLFHNQLMTHQGGITEEWLGTVAAKVGLDAKQVKEKAGSVEVSSALDRNHRLAEALGIRGTPGFVVGKEIIPGAVGLQSLQEKIAAARATKK